MKTPLQWVRDELKFVTASSDLYSEYERFRRETESSMSEESFKRTVRRAFYHNFPHSDSSETESHEPKIMREAEGPNETIVSESYEIRTLEQLLAYCKVDLTMWKVTKSVVNMWGGAKNPNFQVKAWLTRIQENEIPVKREKENFIADAKRYAPKYRKIRYKKTDKNGKLLEISLFDHHFGQLSWGKETEDVNYDTKRSRKLALESIDHILTKAKDFGGVEKILIVVGNDFFNVNSALNTTFSGTPQSEDGRWQKTYTEGRKLWVEIIETCTQIAPVDVLVITGNHDTERAFYLGDSLECWFENNPQVLVDNSPTVRKYYTWGNTLLGFTHGHLERKNTLVNIMAVERPNEWAKAKYKEWHKGHFHAASETAFQVLHEDYGVREWVMPSLVSIDDWHKGKGYSAMRESIGTIWSKTSGKETMLMYHPPEEEQEDDWGEVTNEG